jgi:predicted membrane chloride channel (bestrophin family)
MPSRRLPCSVVTLVGAYHVVMLVLVGSLSLSLPLSLSPCVNLSLSLSLICCVPHNSSRGRFWATRVL